MAKDFALLAEAYKSIYEAGEVTGVVAAPTATSPVQPSTTAASSSINLQASDSKKLIKNLNDIYLKSKENADIMSRNKVPSAKEQFAAQKTYFGQILASILSATVDSANPTVLSGLTGGLDKDLLSFVQPQQNQIASTTPIKPAAK